MARLSIRFTGPFSLSLSLTRHCRSPKPKLSKSAISKPILHGDRDGDEDEDEQRLIPSSHTAPPHSLSPQATTPQAATRPSPPSAYTIPDTELGAWEEKNLGAMHDVEEMLAWYAYPASPMGGSLCGASAASVASIAGIASTASESKSTSASSINIASPPTPTPSVFPSPPSSPSAPYNPDPNPNPNPKPSHHIVAKLPRFADTPPPAPGWAHTCFGPRVEMFGVERVVGDARDARDRGDERDERDERVARVTRDRGDERKMGWRSEFGRERRGYVAL